MKKSFIILTNKYLLILFEATVCGAIKRPYRLMKRDSEKSTAVHILWFHESLLFGSFDKYEQVQSEFLSLFGAVNLILPVKNSTSKLQTPFFRNLFILQ